MLAIKTLMLAFQAMGPVCWNVDPFESTSVNVSPPGQSGLVTAPLLAQIEAESGAQQRMTMDQAHLTDQLDLYEAFQYKPMPFTLAEVMAAQ